MIPEYKLKATTNEDPDYVNWIEKGIVIPSMDVGNCAASYAFATASATSSLYASESGNLTPLSTQQFISCDNTCKKQSTYSFFHYFIIIIINIYIIIFILQKEDAEEDLDYILFYTLLKTE